MTTAAGTEDWQAYGNWHAVPLVNGLQAVPSIGVTLGPFPLHNWASIKVLINTVSTSMAMVVNYWNDQAMTQLAGTYTLYASIAAPVVVLVPADAQWVTITLDPGLSTAMTCYVNVAPCNVATSKLVYSGSGGTLASGNVSVPASGANTQFMGVTAPGPAFLFFGPVDTTGKLTLEMLGSENPPTGAFDLAKWTGPTAEINTLILLPDFAVDFHITNTDAAAAHSFRLTCIPTV